jgi:pleckstrin domain-containing family G protein 5
LRLVDILVRPMQRLTKYSLLLKAILKNTEDLNQRRDLLEMVRRVFHTFFTFRSKA